MDRQLEELKNHLENVYICSDKVVIVVFFCQRATMIQRLDRVPILYDRGWQVGRKGHNRDNVSRVL